MRCLLSFSAEGIVRDAQTNNISAFNILEQFNSPAFPFFIPRIFFFVLLERREEEPPISQLRIAVSNNQQQILEIPVEANFGGGVRHRYIAEIGGLAIPQPGLLSFRLFQEDQELCLYSIEVRVIGEPTVSVTQ